MLPEDHHLRNPLNGLEPIAKFPKVDIITRIVNFSIFKLHGNLWTGNEQLNAGGM